MQILTAYLGVDTYDFNSINHWATKIDPDQALIDEIIERFRIMLSKKDIGYWLITIQEFNPHSLELKEVKVYHNGVEQRERIILNAPAKHEKKKYPTLQEALNNLNLNFDDLHHELEENEEEHEE